MNKINHDGIDPIPPLQLPIQTEMLILIELLVDLFVAPVRYPREHHDLQYPINELQDRQEPQMQ
jgi:hypothetical protein